MGKLWLPGNMGQEDSQKIGLWVCVQPCCPLRVLPKCSAHLKFTPKRCGIGCSACPLCPVPSSSPRLGYTPDWGWGWGKGPLCSGKIRTTIDENRSVWKNPQVVNSSFLWEGIFLFCVFCLSEFSVINKQKKRV